MSQSEIERLFPQILLALQHVHKAGFVHRDIKPSNFMLSTDGTIKLADFGIAKDKNVAAFTETGTQMGTPMYMSPEQIKSTRDVDHRSDIYSLGVVLYEMATGTFPFDKNNLSLPEIQVCILRDPLPKTGSLWDTQIAKATAKNETDRFQSCTNWMEIFAKKEQANVFDKPVDKESQPNTSSTNYSSSSSESTYDTSQKKYLFIGVGVIVFICFLALLMWPEKKVEVVGDATSAEMVIELKSETLSNMNKPEMDKLVAEVKAGKEIICNDCMSEYKIDQTIYILVFQRNRLTDIKIDKEIEKQNQQQTTVTPGQTKEYLVSFLKENTDESWSDATYERMKLQTKLGNNIWGTKDNENKLAVLYKVDTDNKVYKKTVPFDEYIPENIEKIKSSAGWNKVKSSVVTKEVNKK
jgi:serine/threonine protein kinase